MPPAPLHTQGFMVASVQYGALSYWQRAVWYPSKGSEKSCRVGLPVPPLPCHRQTCLAPWTRYSSDRLLPCSGTSFWKADLNLSDPPFPDYSSISVSMFIVRSLENMRKRNDGLDLSIPHHPERTTANIFVYLFPIFLFFL